jgi:hypothetical protein
MTTMNLCRYALCPTPEIPLSLAKRRYHPECAIRVIQTRWRNKNLIGKPTRTYTFKVDPDYEDPEAIEVAYQAALAEIKARPRGEPDLRWYSALHGLKGTGL